MQRRWPRPFGCVSNRRTGSFRTAFPVVPLRVDYALTQKGRSLLPVVVAMRNWGTADLRSPSMDVGD
ncbi:winged helix-turn-helix transcriptional regulator [Tabrizicola sp.]|uniref:winged helix-turn-helix transcriptional regulator n=1 Tax=Tabrizicola sp. TaxID=2005166 RepID=UPI0035B19151